MSLKKILIGPSSFGATDAAATQRLHNAGFEIIPNPFGRKLTKAELLELLTDDVVGLIAGLEPLDDEVLRHSRLKVVSRVGSGVSNVDLDAAAALGIAVRTTPTGPVEAVAELTLGAILSLLREIHRFDRDMTEGRWVKRTGLQLAGRTVAIIGFGRIGRRVAELLAPFRVVVLIVDPACPEGIELDEALPRSDIITLHCSGERLILGKEQIARMKQGAFLLNAARGGLIDEDALLNALDEDRLSGAWLDTYAAEPHTGRLARHPKILATPHIGSYTRECRKAMEGEAVENLLMVLGAG